MMKRITAHHHNSEHQRHSIFQGAVIDDHGNEITITEQMIQKACAALEQENKIFYPRGQALRHAVSHFDQ